MRSPAPSRDAVPILCRLEERCLLTAMPLLATSTALMASSTSVVSGQNVTLTAIVTPLAGSSALSGTVTFTDGGLTLGSAPLIGGAAVISTSVSAVAVHRITASYSGDAQFAASRTGDILTVAGTGTSGPTTSGDPAILATLNVPHGVALDQAGNLYIADTNNHVIREVVKATGQLITVAGNGVQGFGGDGGLATDAEMDHPYAVVVDPDGNLYISDANNNRVREVVRSTGEIVTVAGNGTAGFGGDGFAANDGSVELNNPRGLALDASGNLYIADDFNNRIRKIDRATGQIVTVAGNGIAGYDHDNVAASTAELNDPKDVAVDAAGNIFIADTANNRIREVIHSNGNIVTVAGTGAAGYSGDGGPATSATLFSSLGVALDPFGNIFIADRDNQVIREVIRATGSIVTVAGDGIEGDSGNGGPAIDAQLSNPRGMVADGAGNLYITDATNSAIRLVTLPLELVVKAAPTTTTLGTLTSAPTAGQPITLNASVTVDGPGVGVPSGSVTFFDGSTVLGVGTLDPNAAASIRVSNLSAGPHNIKAIYSGDLRFAGSNFSTISTVAGTGTQGYAGDDGLAVSALLNKPHGIAVDAAGNLFIADTNNQVIREVVKATGQIVTVAGSGTQGFGGDGGLATLAMLSQPAAVAVDSAGNLFIADSGNNRIREVIRATGQIITVAGDGADGNQLVSLQDPRGIAFDAQGNLFIANLGNQGVAELRPDGTLIGVAGNGTAGSSGDGGPATLAELNGPRDVAVDADGNLYIADSENNRIREVIRDNGNIITVAGNGISGYSGDGGPATSARLSSSLGIAVDPLGNLFITDNDNELIREVVKATGQILTIAGNGIVGYSGDGGPATSAALANPRGLAIDSLGNLYITDANNNVIRKVQANVTSAVLDVQEAPPAPAPTPSPSPTPTATSITLSASTPSPAHGQLVTYTAIVQASGSGAATPTGTVIFFDGSTPIGSSNLAGGQATLTTPIYGVGQSHTITASYQGTADFTSSASSGITETVVKADVEVILTVSARTSRRTRGYSLGVILANHQGGLDPSEGTVTYYVGGRVLARQRISSDSATIFFATRVLQGHTVTVRYSGAASFNGGASQVFRITRRGVQPLARPASIHARHATHRHRTGLSR